MFVCKLLPREIISALRGRILRPSGGSHKLSRSHPATKFDCVALVPGGSSHSGVDVVVVCWFFFGTQTQFGIRQVCQVWGPTEHPTLGLQCKFWNTCSALKSGCTPRLRLLAHAGTQGGGSDDVKHYQLHVWSRAANICTVANILMPKHFILLKNSIIEKARCQCGGVRVRLIVCELTSNFQCIF